MKRMIALLIALTLLLGAALPGLAEAGTLPDCFVPGTAVEQFNDMLQQVFHALGASNPAAKAVQYRLGGRQDGDSILWYTSSDGQVQLNGFYPGARADAGMPASSVSLTVGPGVDEADTLALRVTLAAALARTDGSVALPDLVAWLREIGSGTGMRAMNGYMLLSASNDQGLVLTLLSTGLPAAPSGTEAPKDTPEPTQAPTKAPTPTPAPSAEPKALEGAVLDWNGLSIQPLRYEIRVYGADNTSLWLFFRVRNDSDELLRVQADGVTVDGTAVYATDLGKYGAHTDNGEDPSDYLLIKPYTSNPSSARTIAFADSVKLTLVVKDSDYKEQQRKTVTLNLSDLPGERDDTSVFSRSTASPTKAPSATKKPSVTPQPFLYQSLFKGDKGDDVRRLQARLIELGFLNDKADGSFGGKTEAAVRAFNEANGLGSGEGASVRMQEKLFSSSAKGYTEPWIPLDIPRTEWRNATGEGGSYRFKVTNTSKTRTIKGMELRYYVTDVWGNRLWNYDHRDTTFTVTVKPGKSAYTTWFYMSPSWYTIDKIYVGVVRVAFDDGTVHENSSITYWNVSLH